MNVPVLRHFQEQPACKEQALAVDFQAKTYHAG
jgi:hypothetical protein